MNPSTKDLAIIATLSFVIVAIFFVFVPKIEIGTFNDSSAESFVHITNLNSNQQDDIGADEFNDDAPMFIPTKWNSLAQMFQLPKTSTWATTKTNKNNIVDYDIKISPIADAADAEKRNMLIFMRSAFSGFGIKQLPEPQKEESGYVVIRNMATGKVVLKKQLPRITQTEQTAIAEFLLRVIDNTPQAPLIKESSGDENIDNMLIKTIKRLSTTLDNGDYNAQIIQ